MRVCRAARPRSSSSSRLDHLGLGDEVRADDLDRDLAAQPVLRAAVDRAHATLAELLEDREATIELAADERVDPATDPDQTGSVGRATLADLEVPLAGRTVVFARRTGVRGHAHSRHPSETKPP